MKKNIPYIIIGVLALALIALLVTGSQKKKEISERITLSRKDKGAYGAWVAFRALPVFFPGANIYPSRKEPGYWDSISATDDRQLFFSVTPRFMPDEFEMKKLITFAENGNDVFISTKTVSWDVENMLNCSVNDNDGLVLDLESSNKVTYRNDSLHIGLLHPPFSGSRYVYPGRTYDSKFTQIDRSTTDELGITGEGKANFIHLKVGQGNFYLHLAPLAFSNYFLLHKNNMEYFEKALSVIRPGVKNIIWDEYYINRRDNTPPRKKTSWLSVLFRYPALKAALLTAFLTLLIYLLLEMRRKQRYIPVEKKPRNDSMDFVKTIGRLYYDRGDHRNLCAKMAAYFLEHIRSRYKLPTGTLDDQFIRNLQFKTGVSEAEIKGIVSFIQYVNDASAISAGEVMEFHHQLESFYKKA